MNVNNLLVKLSVEYFGKDFVPLRGGNVKTKFNFHENSRPFEAFTIKLSIVELNFLVCRLHKGKEVKFDFQSSKSFGPFGFRLILAQLFEF